MPDQHVIRFRLSLLEEGLTMAKALSHTGNYAAESCCISLNLVFTRVVFRLMSVLSKSCVNFLSKALIHKFSFNAY